jgi:nuclear transport factor 2 (NTF2) superfamily protein
MPMRRMLPLQFSLAAFSLAIGNGSMMKRYASINDPAMAAADRKYHQPPGRRPDDHPSPSALGL